MQLHTLPKLKGVQKRGRRLGRGLGSSKGKTSGHGIKGQSVRNRLKLRRLQIFKQFPFLKGKSGRRVQWSMRPYTVTLHQCNTLDTDKLTPQVLLDAGIIQDTNMPIKILANGSLTHACTFSSVFIFSKNARKKIAEAGGTIQK